MIGLCVVDGTCDTPPLVLLGNGETVYIFDDDVEVIDDPS